MHAPPDRPLLTTNRAIAWFLRACASDGRDELRLSLLQRSMALFGFALFVATWRLWIPQREFPQVPFLRGLYLPAEWFEWLALGLLVAGLAGMLLLTRAAGRAALIGFAAALAVLFAYDQQRFQPWAYQFLLIAIVLASGQPKLAICLLRAFIVSFYFYSALTKFDYTFLHTLGQQFLDTLVRPIGLAPDDWSAHARLVAAGLFPAVELAVAVGLTFRRTRTAALVLSLAVHALLLFILGPWGLNHRPGVLIWNAYFMVQNLILFCRGEHLAAVARKLRLASEAQQVDQAAESPSAARGVPVSTWAAIAVVMAAIALPLLAPSTWFDLWPSWGLYAPSAERVHLLVHRNDRERLPTWLQSYLEHPDSAAEPWQRFRLDRWALDSTGAPVYPQNRVQLGIARGVIDRYGLVERTRVIRFSLADRFSGERSFKIAAGPAELEAATDEYWLGSIPRAAKRERAEPEK
ncbi:MAG TPA: hypothetical protein VL175_03375 [Pirellulales bacterium]|jgi:hypothetical protein|nr:hypothetical protein [Pirellulales bacterium]